MSLMMKKLLNLLNRPLWVDPNTSRVKTDTVLQSGTVTTVTTVTTVAGITNIGGFDAKQTMLYALDRANWNQGVRTRIH